MNKLRGRAVFFVEFGQIQQALQHECVQPCIKCSNSFKWNSGSFNVVLRAIFQLLFSFCSICVFGVLFLNVSDFVLVCVHWFHYNNNNALLMLLIKKRRRYN